MQPKPRSNRRRSPRFPVSVPVTTETMDPVRDPVTGESCFQTSEADATVDLSRLGLRLRGYCSPAVGTRLLVRIRPPEGGDSIDLVGCARWTRVEITRAATGQEALCGIGVELLGGSRRSLDRYERLLAALHRRDRDSVATDGGLG